MEYEPGECFLVLAIWYERTITTISSLRMSLICFVSQCHTTGMLPPLPLGNPPVTGRSRCHLPGAWPGGRGGLCPISVVSRRAACVPDGWPVTSRRSVTAAVTALYRLWQSGGVITVPRSRRPCSRRLCRRHHTACLADPAIRSRR